MHVLLAEVDQTLERDDFQRGGAIVIELALIVVHDHQILKMLQFAFFFDVDHFFKMALADEAGPHLRLGEGEESGFLPKSVVDRDDGDAVDDAGDFGEEKVDSVFGVKTNKL